jgi:hypothetical protein
MIALPFPHTEVSKKSSPDSFCSLPLCLSISHPDCGKLLALAEAIFYIFKNTERIPPQFCIACCLDFAIF